MTNNNPDNHADNNTTFTLTEDEFPSITTRSAKSKKVKKQKIILDQKRLLKEKPDNNEKLEPAINSIKIKKNKIANPDTSMTRKIYDNPKFKIITSEEMHSTPIASFDNQTNSIPPKETKIPPTTEELNTNSISINEHDDPEP